MKTQARKPAGYTLIEVLIVVTIIGVAGAVVVPHMLDASTLGIQAAARTVIADLLYGQNEAVVQQRPRRVVFDTDAERYWLEDEEGQAIALNWRVGGENFVDFNADERFRGVLLAKVTVDAGGNATFVDDGGTLTFEFDELGAPSQGGHVGVIAGEQRFRISVADFTGRVTVRQEQ